MFNRLKYRIIEKYLFKIIDYCDRQSKFEIEKANYSLEGTEDKLIHHYRQLAYMNVSQYVYRILGDLRSDLYKGLDIDT